MSTFLFSTLPFVACSTVKIDYQGEGGVLTIPPHLFFCCFTWPYVIAVILCRSFNENIGLRALAWTRFPTFRREITKSADTEDGTEKSPGLKNKPNKLKNSEYGKFGVGHIDSGVRMFKSHFLCKATAIHTHFFLIAAAVQEVDEIIIIIKHRTRFFYR